MVSPPFLCIFYNFSRCLSMGVFGISSQWLYLLWKEEKLCRDLDYVECKLWKSEVDSLVEQVELHMSAKLPKWEIVCQAIKEDRFLSVGNAIPEPRKVLNKVYESECRKTRLEIFCFFSIIALRSLATGT